MTANPGALGFYEAAGFSECGLAETGSVPHLAWCCRSPKCTGSKRLRLAAPAARRLARSAAEWGVVRRGWLGRWRVGDDGLVRVLIPLPDRDFDVTEVAVPWRVLRDAGHEVVFATERAARFPPPTRDC